MPVLRSREIPPPPNPSSSKTLKKGFIEPSTPTKIIEYLGNLSLQATTPSPKTAGLGLGSTPISAQPRRRSLRLASKSNSGENDFESPSSTRKRGRRDDVDESENDGNSRFHLLTVEAKNVSLYSLESVSVEENGIRISNFDEGKVMVENKEKLDSVIEANEFEESGIDTRKKVNRSSDLEEIEVKEGNKYLCLRSGTRVVKRMSIDSISITGTEADVNDEKGKTSLMENGGSEVKMLEDDLSLNNRKSTRRFSREEKGKGKLINNDFHSNSDGSESEMLKLKLGLDYSNTDLKIHVKYDENVDKEGSMDSASFDISHLPENVALQAENPVTRSSSRAKSDQIKSMMDQFKDIARRNASKYAHFNAQEEVEDSLSSEAEVEVPLEQPEEKVEDWPGPFSTAMKIIRDREKNLGGQTQNVSSEKGQTPLISWTPRKERDSESLKRAVPSLQSLCLTILSKNVDAITSLKYVPDVLRHKLSQLLCDSRMMNGHFLDLLLDGAPSEIRLPDCSWLEEDKFEKSFEGCNMNNLTVLQLDLCGHCVSDSSLLKGLVPKGLPALTTVSLKGACRISDVGLSALVSTTPGLRSINLSECSLLTDVGINNLANSLGSILKELYLDDCESLDAIRILPVLKRLKHLEVLSLRGIGSVSDKFIRELMSSNGHNLKELVLAKCVKLTDSSLKVIAEMCSQLCVLDLAHLSKLTDIGIAYLANGCRGIQVLKFFRSPFSDDAVAAFLEASGESLRELSLNNIPKVGQNTTISLARRCKNLESLDLSFCRSLTDESLGFIADSCLSLRLLKLFGSTQVTRKFVDGHSNPNLQIIGLQLTPILEHIKRPDFQQGPLHYSSVTSF